MKSFANLESSQELLQINWLTVNLTNPIGANPFCSFYKKRLS